MSIKHAYICNKCKAQNIQNNLELPSGWTCLLFKLTRTSTKPIEIHLCPTCREAVDIPAEAIDPEQTQEEKLLQLIQDIATDA
jgi:uncharacterized protein YlaI